MDVNLTTAKERASFACRRWFARIIDLSVASVLYTFITACLVHFKVIPNTINYFGMVVFPLAFYIVVDTVLMAIVKTTLGRSITCLMWENSQGGELTFSQLFKRNLKVWASGFWCGFLSPIPFIIQYFKVKKDGVATYDRNGTIRIVPMQYGSWRFVAGVVVIGVCFSMSNQMDTVFPDVEMINHEDAELYQALEPTAKKCLEQSEVFKQGIEKSGIWKLLGDKTGKWYVDQIHAIENRRRIKDARSVAQTMLAYAESELALYGCRRADSSKVKAMLQKHNDVHAWYQKRCRVLIQICDQAEIFHILLLKLSGCDELVSPQDQKVLSKFSRLIATKDMGLLKAQAEKLDSLIAEYVKLGKQ